jgi:WD40 repeat protein
VIAVGTDQGSESSNRAIVLLLDSKGKRQGQLAGHRGRVAAITFDPSGRSIATGGSDRAVKLWDRDTGKLLRSFTSHRGAVTGVAFTEDGRRLLSAGSDGTVRIHDIGAGQELASLDAKGAASGLALHHGSGRLVSGVGSNVRLWDGAPGREVLCLPVQPAEVLALALRADGKELAFTTDGKLDPVTHRSVAPGELRIWALDPLRERLVLANPTIATRAPLAFAPRTNRLTVSTWQPTERRRVVSVYAPDGELFGLLPPLRSNNPRWPFADVYALAYSPDGSVLALGGGPFDFREPGVVELLDSRNGQVYRRLIGPRGPITCLSFSGDGKRVSAGSADFTIALWNVPRPPETAVKPAAVPVDRAGRILNGHASRITGVAFSPDGKSVFSSSADGAVKGWEAKTGAENAISFSGHEAPVGAIAVSPGGDRIAAGGDDGTVFVWDAVRGQKLLRLAGHEGAITAVVFSPNGRRLYTSSRDRTVRGWDVSLRR